MKGGEIIATGPGHCDEYGNIAPLDANYGDRVLFAKYSDTGSTIVGLGQLILRESVVLRMLNVTALLSKVP